jgi:hypothetical protein
MPTDIFEHPDAPDVEALGEFIVEPVAPEDVRRFRAKEFTLVEDNLIEREDLDVRMPLQRAGQDERPEIPDDIGTYLYRYTQLFGTPQHPDYLAGQDIRDRTNETFKYVLRVTAPEHDELPEEWLMTIFDWKVGLGAGVADWYEDPADAEVRASRQQALTTLQLAHNIGSEPIQCEYEEVWY